MDLMFGATTRPWNTFSLEQACQSIAAAGYPECAVFANAGVIPVTSANTAAEAKAVGRTCRDAGVEPSMLLGGPRLDIPVDAAVADYRLLIDACAALGAKWLMNGGTEDPATFATYHEIMRQCAPYAETKGVGLNMKPHGGIGLTGPMMVEALEAVDHPNFTLCYDPGNIIYYTKGELRPETDVDAVAGRVATCMIKDCIVVDDKPDVWIMVGEGWVNFEVVLGKLVAGGFDGPLHLECLGGDELEDINGRAVRAREIILDIVAAL